MIEYLGHSFSRGCRRGITNMPTCKSRLLGELKFSITVVHDRSLGRYTWPASRNRFIPLIVCTYGEMMRFSGIAPDTLYQNAAKSSLPALSRLNSSWASSK